MGKVIFTIGALAGGITLSQFPEFSQQYLQRLGGQVDALSQVVQDFDQTASRNGMTREAALLEMTGTPFLSDRQSDLRRSFLRHAQLSDNLVALRSSSALERLTMPQRLGDHETLTATWAEYRPAVPVTLDGATATGIGAVAGGFSLMALWGLLKLPFRRFRWA